MTFAEGVAFAKALRKRAQGFWLNPAVMGPLGLQGLHVTCAWLWRGIPGRRTAMRAALVTLAGEDAKAQAWLRVRIAEALEAGEAIPPAFIEWLAQWLRDPKAPKGESGRPFLSTRDEILAYTIRELVAKGLKKRQAIEATGEAWALSPGAIRIAIGLKRKAPSWK